jgi:hypothetical protein
MSKRLAQFGGVGGMSNQGAPGRSPIMFGNSGNNKKPNAIQPDVVFDSLLSPFQIGCDTERSIESQLEAFHDNAEEDTIAYMDPQARQKIKDGQYLQRRDKFRYQPLTETSKHIYPKYVTMETALDKKRVNDDKLLNQENTVEHIQPDRIHMASKKINDAELRRVFSFKNFEDNFEEEFGQGLFGMNGDAGEIVRTPTSTPFTEDDTKDNISDEGEEKFHMDPGGFNSPSSQYTKGDGADGGRTGMDVDHMLNDDKDVSVGGYGNNLPTGGQFSTLAEGATANFVQPDQYYQYNTDPNYQAPALDDKLKTLLDGIMNDNDATMEEKLTANNAAKDGGQQGLPHDPYRPYSQYDRIGNDKDNKFRHEAEGWTNLNTNNPGSLAQPSVVGG